MKQLMLGNAAVARGLYEAGCCVVSSYPGTPSTEITEEAAKFDDIYCEWAPNEKVATEVAIGAALGGVRSLTAMKHVGVNVAADPIFTAAYNGVDRGFVIVSADDPSMHSSQNEQDNRHYARAARLPMVEPSDSQECVDFMKAAFEISEQWHIPVLYRVTTRVCHSKSLVEFSDRKEIPYEPFVRNIASRVSTPANAYRNHSLVEKKMAELAEYGNTCPLNRMELKGNKIGVVTAGITYQYAKEAFPEDTSFLKLGLTNPLPMDLIREFASKVEKLYVMEELDPFIEDHCRNLGLSLVGKDKFPCIDELSQNKVAAKLGTAPEAGKTLETAIPNRPPVMCAGCPHRGLFYTLNKMKLTVLGDIGCYTLGCAAPLNAMDSVVCMGGGFSVAMGMSKAFEVSGETGKKVFGVVGDSTFFHSGMTGAAEIIYNKGNMIPVILDNSITGMTGHQDNPGTGYTLQGDIAEAIRMEDVLQSMGFQNVIIVDPQDLKAMQKAVDDALASPVPAAIITRRPCLLIKRIKHDIGLCEVDADKCIGCKKCLKVGCPAVCMKDGKSTIDPTLCVGCTVCAQVCPVGAISRKE